jgi:hypothetical protein
MITAENQEQTFRGNLVKFGVLPGLAIAFVRITYSAFLSPEGLTREALGIALTTLAICVVFGGVLGLIRRSGRSISER